MITFHIVTLFPDVCRAYLDASILGRAQEAKKVRIKYYNPRDFTKDKLAKTAKGSSPDQQSWYRTRVDRRPYGGGPGMVLEAESVLKAAKKAMGKKKAPVYFFDTTGEQFTNEVARKVARNKKVKDLVLICGHYEGIDARVQKILKAKKISVGPYTLTGGELPAMLVIDAIARQVPGVLGTFESIEEERVSSAEVYTRPEVLKWGGRSYKVPPVLLSGNHKLIEEWKKGS